MTNQSNAKQKVLAATRSAVKRFVPPERRQQLQRTLAGLGSIDRVKENQAWLALHLAMLEAERDAANGTQAQEVPDDRFPTGIRSRLCTQAQLSEPWFSSWIANMAERPRANRKAWEWAYIAHALDTMGMLKAGRRGIGFGVGHDPLVPLFAARDVELLATDLDAAAQEAAGWVETGQHADTLDNSTWPSICDDEKFQRLVSWRHVDMRAIPDDLSGFDFCWSACALEHLGSLEAGLEFIERSLATVVPGGIAVHTTEYNVHSNDDTVETGPCVVYRERDIRDIVERLESAGHEVAALDLSPGDGALDHYVDVPPYEIEACLKFVFGSYTLTSIALVIRTRS